MNAFLYLVFGFIGFVLLIGVVWRFFSRRLTLPCPSWLSWLVELDNPFTQTNRASVIISHLELKPGMKVLDAGCGPGRLTIPLAEKVGPDGEVTAMDIQQGMLDRVKEKAKLINLNNIIFLHAKLGNGKLEKNHYDRALLITVLGEIPNKESAIKEIFDSLKPGGILLVTEVIFDPYFQNRKRVTQFSEAAGFEILNIFGNRFAFTMQMQKPI